MKICAECGKKLGILDGVTDLFGTWWCTTECMERFKKKKLKDKQRDKEQKEKDKEMEAKGTIKEFKCKCNQCGKVWHYLESDFKSVKSQQMSNALIGAGMCCNPFGAYFSNKSLEQGREADKFNKCPSCNSADITKTAIYHEKKT